MQPHPDYIGWIIGAIGVLIGIAGWIYAVVVERRARHRRSLAHTALVNLKPAIQGENRQDVIAAINDTLEKLKD